MNKAFLCRLFGHQWNWPDIVVTPMPGGIQIQPCWRECARCHHRERDEQMQARLVILPRFQGPVQGFATPPRHPNCRSGSPKMDALGEKVKRAMGWDS